MQQLMSYMRSAMEQYTMIEPGDRIAVGLSGGKDSVALLGGLAELRRFYPAPYELEAVTLDPMFEGRATDYSPIADLCRSLSVPYTVKRTNLGNVIFEERREKNPCSLCAKMRRGILHDTAKSLRCNKVALGHHLDDAAETFYMNLLMGGRLACFSPKSYLSRKDLHLIRPMVFAFEKDVIRAMRRENLPVVKSRCPVDGVTQRQRTKELIQDLEKSYGALRSKTLGALQKAHISGW